MDFRTVFSGGESATFGNGLAVSEVQRWIDRLPSDRFPSLHRFRKSLKASDTMDFAADLYAAVEVHPPDAGLKAFIQAFIETIGDGDESETLELLPEDEVPDDDNGPDVEEPVGAATDDPPPTLPVQLATVMNAPPSELKPPTYHADLLAEKIAAKRKEVEAALADPGSIDRRRL